MLAVRAVNPGPLLSPSQAVANPVVSKFAHCGTFMFQFVRSLPVVSSLIFLALVRTEMEEEITVEIILGLLCELRG